VSACAHSFVFAALTSSIILALGMSTTRWRVGAWLWIPFFCPGRFAGHRLDLCAESKPLAFLYHSIGVVIIAFTVRYWPSAGTRSRFAARSVDADLTDAGAVSGASFMATVVARALAATGAATGGGLVRDLSAVPVGCRVARAHRASRRRNACATYLQPASLRPQYPGECALFAPALVGDPPLLVWGCWQCLCALLKTRASFRPPPSSSSSNQKQSIEDEDDGRGRERSEQWVFAHFLQPRLPPLVLCGAALFLPGCAEKTSNLTPIQSRFFSSVQVIGTRGAGLGEFNKPRSVAVDSNDNFYAVDMTGRVQKFSPDGSFLLSWQLPQTDKGKAKGMCRDAAGNIVVVEPHYSRVNHFSPEAKPVAQWGEHGTNAGQLVFPRAVAVNSRGEIFVSEYGVVERVQGFLTRR